MNITTYLQCLSYRGVTTGVTGSVMGAYDFTSFDSEIINNQLISPFSGQYISGLVYTNTMPLISLGSSPNGVSFTSNSCYTFGNDMTGDYSLFIDLDYNGCLRKTSGTDYVLLSNINSISGINSGFCLGVNESNRLFLKTSGLCRTLPFELKPKDIVFFSNTSNKYLNFGVFDVSSSQYVTQSITLANPFASGNPLYLGGFLNNTNVMYTGYSGNINNLVLFDSPFNLTSLSGCIDCLFVSGFNLTTGTNAYYIPVITGYVMGQQSVTGIQSYVTVTGNLTKSNGGTIPYYYLSGVTGVNITNVIASVLTGTNTILITGDPSVTYLYNNSILGKYSSYNIELTLPVGSGDFVEIYTYNYFNPKIGGQIDTNFDYPFSPLNVQLIGNGLLETTGIDYFVNNGTISGYDIEDWVTYDLVSGTKLISPYSGLWSRSKIAMSGGGFFPPVSQFIESGSGIIITGITGATIPANYDVYLNGQKLISGNYFSRIQSGAYLLMVISGADLPDFWALSLSSPTGGLPMGIYDINDSEIAFYPVENNPNKYSFILTGNQSVFTNITGFSEEVWVNGVRQPIGYGYLKDFGCLLNSGNVTLDNCPFNFYDNDSSYFNIN